jgi:rod shape-determining protein MreC
VLLLAVSPIHVVVDFPFSVWQSATGSLSDRRELARENAQLKRQLAIAQYRLQELNAAEMEIDRLQELLDTSEELSEDRVLIARILRADLEHYRHRFMINRGKADGVYVGQPLIDASGVVGQVEFVTWNRAEALLITDPDHSIPVTIERTGLRTFADGTGDPGQLRLSFLTNDADIEVGDMIVTSGLGNVFPAGRPVAVIDRFERRPGREFADVTARPVSELDRDQEVLLVWNEEREVPDEPDAILAEAGQ